MLLCTLLIAINRSLPLFLYMRFINFYIYSSFCLYTKQSASLLPPPSSPSSLLLLLSFIQLKLNSNHSIFGIIRESSPNSIDSNHSKSVKSSLICITSRLYSSGQKTSLTHCMYLSTYNILYIYIHLEYCEMII